ALTWALGCLAAALRQRASFLAVMVVSARLCIALAAGAFGAAHVAIGGSNLSFKLAQMAGVTLHGLTRTPLEWLQPVALIHWLGSFATMGFLGGLHIAAAMMLAVGRHDWVHRLALGIIVLELAFALFGASGFTFPAIYLVLITMMAVASSILAWLWAWDE